MLPAFTRTNVLAFARLWKQTTSTAQCKSKTKSDVNHACRDGAGGWPSKAEEFNSMLNNSVAARSGSALRHRWIALQKRQNSSKNAGLANTAKFPAAASSIRSISSAGTSSTSASSSSRKRHRERTSLSYDEIIDRLDLGAEGHSQKTAGADAAAYHRKCDALGAGLALIGLFRICFGLV